MNVVACSGVTKSFGTSEVLRGVDLTISRGASVAVTGPSGSGKSTLMAVLGLLTRRDGGALQLLDVEVAPRASARTVIGLRRRMAWLPQLPLVLPGRTCLDNALSGIRARRDVTSDDILSATALFARLGISELRHRDISVLSGGEFHKVALVRALLVCPELLLADEPTASLDGSSTEAVVDALRAAARLCTLVVATHDPAVTQACERVVTLRDGVVVEVAP